MASAAASGRIRRSVRFAQLDAQATAAAREAQPRRERMTVTGRLEMPSYENTQDWTSGMGMSPSGRFQVVEKRSDQRRAISREGIRRDWARIILGVMAAVMCAVLLAEFAAIGSSAMRTRRLEVRMASARNQGEKLQRDIADMSGDISVVTRAVELNLISSGGAATILLTAPEGANMRLMDTQEAQATEEPELRAALAGAE